MIPVEGQRTEVVVVSAEDDAALLAEIDRLTGFLDRVPDVPLADVAFTCASRPRGGAVLALVVSDSGQLRERLVSAAARIRNPDTVRICDRGGSYWYRRRPLAEGGRLAFIYPGVMGFYPDMLRDVAVEFPVCRAAFDELEEAMDGKEDFTPSSFVFPPASYYSHDADIFRSGAYAQALVSTYTGCSALTRLLSGFGIGPDGIVGCAGGDLAAVMLSGAAGELPLPRPDRVRAMREIYAIVDRAVSHSGLPRTTMVTALLRRGDELDPVLAAFPPGKVELAIDLSPRQKTFAIDPAFEDEALAAFASAGIRVLRLALDRPFNTPRGAPIVPAVAKFAAAWMKRAALCDVYSCGTAARLPAKPRPARKETAERWAMPVRFAETIRTMYADGYRVFLEVGPSSLMTSAVDDTLKGTGDYAAIAMNSPRRRGVVMLQHALAHIAALGAPVDFTAAFARRRVRRLDFDAVISLGIRRDVEMKLSRAFPRLTLLGDDVLIDGGAFLAESSGRGAKAARRAAAVAAQARRQRRFDFGAVNPLVSDADIVAQSPGISVEITKVFRFSDAPFLADFAIGNSQLSYSDPNLKGLVLLSMPVGVEIMAEVARMVVPNRELVAIDDFVCRRLVPFSLGALRLYVRAERVSSSDPSLSAVKVQLRDVTPDGAYTWPVMEGTFLLAADRAPAAPAAPTPLSRPRSVHWSGRDIYPTRLCSGRRLRGITFADAWSESGLDYEVAVPTSSDALSFTRFPMWLVDPLLFESVVSGFALWRSYEKVAGSFSYPFRLRRLDLSGGFPKEGATLKCYLRLTGVTPKSHICDILVSDGNGGSVMSVSGWEELTERIPAQYRQLVLQPAMTFLTEPLSPDLLGRPATDVASAVITDVPYALFERNEELWLRMVSHIVLNGQERDEFKAKSGSASRRTEWLFGRIAAKEAVRRFLKDFYQARWSDADVAIWADDLGKPHPLGEWSDYLTTKLDIAIAHTAQFVVAVAAANARVGVDVESTARDLSEEFCAGVFGPEELELARSAASPSLALIRFWCAKEAVSKALGTGIRYSPKEMRVNTYLPEDGVITVRLEGAWVGAFKNFKGRDIGVSSRIVREHALAFCFLSTSLFNED